VNRQRRVVSTTLCATFAVAGWVAAGPADLGSFTIESAETPIEVIRTTAATVGAEHVAVFHAATLNERSASVADAGRGRAAMSEARQVAGSSTPPRNPSPATPDPAQNEAKEITGSIEVAHRANGSVALSENRTMPDPAAPPVLFAMASPTDPVQKDGRPATNSKVPGGCLEPDACIDQYLWSLYERTPKVDTVKVEERIKVKVKNKGKTRTVVKSLIKYVTEDFAWKDPKAAQKAGMSLKDYVIGGMDRDFKRKLHDALRAMEEAGFSPGITSAFRDDYRQEIATGNKAAADSSYHGGSRRGGYGHGLAADLVSVKGGTRAERCTWSESLWRWIDAHEKELGIGRPYLDKDPPHVAPIDGKEYADKRGPAKARLAVVKRSSLSSKTK